MYLGYLGCVLRQDEDEIHRICPGNRETFDPLERIGLIGILGCAFENGLETGCILQLFVGVLLLVSL